jgi:hypothetical protein
MPQRHRSEISESVTADPLGSYRRTPRTFNPGRTCAAVGCQTVLSIYNGAKHCAAHNPKQLRVKRPYAAPTSVALPAERVNTDSRQGRPERVRRLIESAREDVRQEAS